MMPVGNRLLAGLLCLLAGYWNQAAALTLQRGDLLVADYSLKAVYLVAPASGAVELFSGENRGTGRDFGHLTAIAEEADGSILVTDSDRPAVIRVDRLTGNRNLVSGPGRGGGIALQLPAGIAVDTAGDILVADQGLDAVLRIDPVSGDRRMLSTGGSASHARQGSGPAFMTPASLSFDTDGKLLVADNGVQALLRVDPPTGDRTVLSGPGAGSGPAFTYRDTFHASPTDVMTGDETLLAVGWNTVFRVNPVTGDRTVLSGAGRGSGPDLLNLTSLARTLDGNLVMTDGIGGRVLAVHPGTGARSVISEGFFTRPRSIEVVETDTATSLVLARQVMPTAAGVGEAVTYTLLLHNPGSATARNVVLTDQLPDGIEVGSIAPQSDECRIETTNRVVCEFGDLPAGGREWLQITVTANAAGEFCNTATVEADNLDEPPEPGPAGAACLQAHVLFPTLEKTGSETVPLGGEATYTIKFTTGSYPIRSVELIDRPRPDKYLQFIRVEPAGACEFKRFLDLRFICHWDNLPAMSEVTITATARAQKGNEPPVPPNGGMIINEAELNWVLDDVRHSETTRFIGTMIVDGE